jgi:hypothetical protein
MTAFENHSLRARHAAGLARPAATRERHRASRRRILGKVVDRLIDPQFEQRANLEKSGSTYRNQPHTAPEWPDVQVVPSGATRGWSLSGIELRELDSAAASSSKV